MFIVSVSISISQPIYGRKKISLLTELTAFLEGLFYKHFAATRLTPTE